MTFLNKVKQYNKQFNQFKIHKYKLKFRKIDESFLLFPILFSISTENKTHIVSSIYNNLLLKHKSGNNIFYFEYKDTFLNNSKNKIILSILKNQSE